MFKIIFCAVEAFMRVDPETISGPTSASIVMSTTWLKSEFALHVIAAVFAPQARAYSVAPTT